LRPCAPYGQQVTTTAAKVQCSQELSGRRGEQLGLASKDTLPARPRHTSLEKPGSSSLRHHVISGIEVEASRLASTTPPHLPSDSWYGVLLVVGVFGQSVAAAPQKIHTSVKQRG
jgi:hypothetical protein